MPVSVRLAGKADREALAQMFHAIEVHYWGERAPTREAVARHVEQTILTCPTCEIGRASCRERV